MTLPLIQFKNLIIGYPSRPISSPLSFEIPEGIRLGIIGGNGTGKSTLVKTLLGLTPPFKGSYQWKQKTTFAYVPQESQIDSLFPLKVLDLLKMGWTKPLPRLGRSSKEFRKTAKEVLTLFEMDGFEKRLFRELSGGQRQRVLIARAWMSNPHVIVLDEPHNSLDYAFREKLWEILEKERREYSLSLFMIDHDLNRILNQVDWLCVLGPSEIICGPKEEILEPNILSRVYKAPLHIHQEDHAFQIHFL